MMLDAKIVHCAEEMVDAAGTVIKKYFRQPLEADDKPDNSPVTKADKESETVIRNLIEKHFPSHGIIGEEFGSINEGNDWVWVIDPIDGTKAFISGKPSFGTLLALTFAGNPVLGIINQPITNERWLGITGQETLFNGNPVKTRKCPNIKQASLYATEPEMFNGDDKTAFNNLSSQVKMTRFGADCYAYGLLAMGFIDIVCEASLKRHDFMAMRPIIEGAGGVITDWQGKELNINSQTGKVIAIGDKALLALSLESLAV
ncbi:MAG: histidinol-phosphatase [Alphaproteobacteria bacterium]